MSACPFVPRVPKGNLGGRSITGLKCLRPPSRYRMRDIVARHYPQQKQITINRGRRQRRRRATDRPRIDAGGSATCCECWEHWLNYVNVQLNAPIANEGVMPALTESELVVPVDTILAVVVPELASDNAQNVTVELEAVQAPNVIAAALVTAPPDPTVQPADERASPGRADAL